MAYSFELTSNAINEINNTLEYICINLKNKNAAIKLMQNIEDSISEICAFPFSFPDCTYFNIDDLNIRHKIINNYALIYKVIHNKIVIISFVYSKTNINFEI